MKIYIFQKNVKIYYKFKETPKIFISVLKLELGLKCWNNFLNFQKYNKQKFQKAKQNIKNICLSHQIDFRPKT